MRHTTDTLPDRGVDVSHLVHSEEKWYGVLISKPPQLDAVKGGLDGILEKHGYVPSIVDGPYWYCKGKYSPEVLEKIRRYLADSKVQEPVVMEGKDADFLGTYWLKKATEH
ncbi:hypothetical protein HY638_04470 [Candidatus Woesearchaeota archaeon]|nr:hypothetical protein [Candidatus Woesearchaeota archaeon]